MRISTLAVALTLALSPQLAFAQAAAPANPPAGGVNAPVTSDDQAPAEDRTFDAYLKSFQGLAQLDLSKGNPDEVFIVQVSDLTGEEDAAAVTAARTSSQAAAEALQTQVAASPNISALVGELQPGEIVSAAVKPDGKIILYVDGTQN